MTETLEQFRARLIGAAISTYVIVTLIVPLKLWCRMSVGRWRSLELDDYLCIVALACANAFFYVCLSGMRPYLARHALTDVQLDEVINFLRYLFASQLLYFFTLAMIKYTILAFYWRIFSVKARIPILIGVFLVTAWLFSIVVLVIFTCSPVEAQWDLTITESKCISLGVVYISGSALNIVTNLIILVLPIQYIWRLQARNAQRLILSGIFMLGCFVSIVSIVRLIISVGIPLSSSDVTYNTKDIILWSVVEINIGLVCACLPSMKPALQLLHLDRLVAGSTGRDQATLDPNKFPPNMCTALGERSRGQKLVFSGGIFSSLAELAKLDDEEDSFEMIDKIHTLRGKTESNIESLRRTGDASDADTDGHELKGSQDGGINIQRNWSVLIDEKSNLRK